MASMIRLLNKAAAKFEYKIVRNVVEPGPDMLADKQFMELYQFCRPFTMTSPERLFSLYQSVKYVIQNQVPGDFVECGVWKGGSSMMIAKVLQSLGVTNRTIWMYDTYEGMTEPTKEDRDYTGEDAVHLLNTAEKSDSNSVWCYSALEEVQLNMQKTGYPAELIKYIKGKVEETIPGAIPVSIALLRLDTDWYASTYHEMNHLYPLLQVKGVLIIDDFGHWEGAKKAILQYFSENKLFPLINRIDETGRLVLKT
jgi:O-methyltransferase